RLSACLVLIWHAPCILLVAEVSLMAAPLQLQNLPRFDSRVIERESFDRPELNRILGGGFVATLAMTLITYLGPFVGLANVDLAGILGAVLSGGIPRIFSGTWWAGMVWHFINGAVFFPLIYAYLVLPTLGIGPRTKGALWGVMLWLLAQMLVMPMMGG